MRYDIIGDIHGEHDKLVELLRRLGYRQSAASGGAYAHPTGRQAVFVGDLVDRGPHQLEVIDTVRRMVDGGHAKAIMGNHELNAVAFWMEDPACPGRHLRRRDGSRGTTNRNQHQAFLDAVGEDSSLHKELVTWFTTLPLFLELPGDDGHGPGIRVAHACWDVEHVAKLREWLPAGDCVGFEQMPMAASRGNWVNKAVETICKGPEMRLPAGHFYLDKEGGKRTKSRIRWWAPEAVRLRDVVLMPDSDAMARLPDVDADGVERPVCDTSVPTFFGHYWMKGSPTLMGPTMACLDYSVAKGGELVAYRWDGETELSELKFVTTGPEHAPAVQVPARRRP